MLEKKQKKIRRHKRVRAKIKGRSKAPRLCVFRSAKHIYAQLIDDNQGRTLISAGERELKPGSRSSKTKTATEKPKNKEDKIIRTGKVAVAYELGKLIAKKSLEKKIERVVFDRGGYKYHGQVKALAEGAREGGLKF